MLEFGVFLIICIFAAICFFLGRRLYAFYLLCAVLICIPALFLISGQDIVQTSAGYNVTKTISGESDGSAEIVSYDVQSSTGQVLINNVSSQTQAELASSSSSALVGDVIDCMTVWLGKAGSPPASDITFGVFNTNNEVVKLFGTQLPNDMASSAITPYTHCLTSGQTHTILNGQYIGVNYADGDGSNTITMRVDGNNPFDGTLTYRSQYVSSWSSSTGQDIMMRLYLSGSDGESSTTTESEVIPDRHEIVLSSNQFAIGWLFMGLAIVPMTGFFFRALGGGN